MLHLYSGLKTTGISLLLAAIITLSTYSAKAQVAGNALSFDANEQDFVTLPAGIVSGVSGDFTIECWVLWRGGNNFFPRILDFGFAGNTADWLAFTPTIPFGNQPPRFGISIGGNFQFVDATNPLPINTWNHLAVTLDATNQILKIYVNGQLEGTNTNFPYTLANLGITTTNKLGESKFAGDPYFDGVIDELRISRNIRYTSDFIPATTAFAPDANTVIYYRFEEGTGQTSADASGNFAAATLGGNTTDTNNDPSWINAITLPVRMDEFDVFVNARSVNLTWKASSDLPSSFEIQRSANGVDFTTIGTVSKNSGFGRVEVFCYADSRPNIGRNFYRLKYFEIGGPINFTTVKLVHFGTNRTPVIYPNPLTGRRFHIDFTTAISGQVEVRLINASGLEVSRYQQFLQNQREIIISSNSSLLKGNYFVEVWVEKNRRFTGKLLVQ